MLTTTQHESTARTLLNMQLVALYRQGKAIALTDPTEFLTSLLAHDKRLERLLQETRITIEPLRDYLQESLKELCLAESRKLVPMLAPVPPNLELVMVYTGQRQALFTDTIRDGRHLGFFWSASHVYCEDGLGCQ